MPRTSAFTHMDVHSYVFTQTDIQTHRRILTQRHIFHHTLDTAHI